MDELAFAAAMLYKATGEEQYKADAERYFDQAEYSNTQEVGALKPLTAVLMAQLDPSNDKYFAEVGSGVCGWVRVWGEGGRAFGWEMGRGTMRGCNGLSGPWRAGDGVGTGISAAGPAAEAQPHAAAAAAGSSPGPGERSRAGRVVSTAAAAPSATPVLT
jgi:hypothetical protein